MSNQFTPKAHCIWGIPPHFSIADLPPGGSERIQIINAATANVTSSAVNVNARGVELVCVFNKSTLVCDLELYTSISGTDTLVKSFPGVSAATCSNLFAGNLEFVDLDGAAIKVKALNMVNPDSGTLSVYARPTY